MIEKLFTLGSRGRWGMALLLVVLSALAASQLPHLRIDRSDAKLVGEEADGWSDLLQMERDFGADHGVLIYLRADNLWTEERLKAIQNVGFALEEVPGVTSVKTLLDATNIRDKGDYVDAGPLIDIVPSTPEELAQAKDDALYSPLIRETFIAEDGHATALALSYQANPDDPRHELRMHAAIEEKIAPLRPLFREVFQLGWPRLSHEIDRGLMADLELLTPLSVMVLLITVTFFLRSVRVVPIPLITAGITILWTLGFMAAVDIPVTLLTAILPALIIVVGSVEDVHLASSYLEGLDGENPGLRKRAVDHMARHVGPAILITSFTTVIGFASNVITEIPMIREFSIAAAFAMGANLVVTVAAMPIMLHSFGPLRNPLRTANEVPAGLIGWVVRRVEFLTEQHARKVVVAFVLVLGVAAAQIVNLKVNNDPMTYFHEKHAFVEHASTVHEDLSGLKSFGIILRAREKGWFKTSEGLETIARVQSVVASEPIYDKTLSLADLMALMHQEMHKGDKAFNVVPKDQTDFDLYLSSMPRSELASFVTEDFSVAQIQVRHDVSDSGALNAAVDKLLEVLPALVGDNATFAVTAKDLMINRAAESLIEGEFYSLALILTVIFCLFSFLYTSWHAGVLALVPNLIPIVLNFGVMSYLGVPLNPGTAMVAAIAIGLAVDDTIHLMTRFGAESRLRLDEREAVRATIRGESVPVLTTAVALALGFAVFGLSGFRIVAEFGLLAAGTMVYAAMSDLMLMPILLKHLRLATVWDIVNLKVDEAVLNHCPLFRGMSPYQIKKIILLSDMLEFGPGDALIRQGESSTGMFVLLAGTVDVIIQRDGAEMVVDRGKPGDLFGEIGFASRDVARTATIIATSRVSAIRLDAERAQRGMRFYPGIAIRLFRNISRVLGARLVASHERLLRTPDMH